MICDNVDERAQNGAKTGKTRGAEGDGGMKELGLWAGDWGGSR